MAETWRILALEIVGEAKRARVQHTLPDGTTTVREYGWPRSLTKDGMTRTLDNLHAQLEAVPKDPPGYDETLDLLDVPRDPEALTEPVAADPAAAPTDAPAAEPPVEG